MTAPVALLVVLAVVLTGCAGDSEPAAEPAAASPELAEQPAEVDEPLDLGGPTEKDYRRAEALVSRMNLAERAGQVIVARYDGTQPPVDLVRDLHLGGVIVMGYNVGDVATLRDRNARLATQARDGVPLVIAVDQEGGLVARVGLPATEFPTFMSHGAARDLDLTREASAASGRELRALGFTMVYAPDADVTIGPADPTIGSRAASDDPDLVAETVLASLAGYAEAGIVSVAKHFPGHGSVPADSHLELPSQTKSLRQLEKTDLVPFAAAAQARAPSMMVAHIDVESIDAGTPSSLSGKVIEGVLRGDLNYEGVVSTDALDMGAVVKTVGDPDEAGVQALRAGADVLLMPVDARGTRDAIVAAVEDGRLQRDRVTEAAQRLVALMLHQGGQGKAPPASEVGANAAVSRAVSSAAATVVDGPCRRPYEIRDSLQILGGTEEDRARLADAARDAGLTVGSGPRILLLSSTPSSQPVEVAVSLDRPYILADAQAEASIALYGRTPQAFRALVEVLTGKERAKGSLPVAVSGVSRSGC